MLVYEAIESPYQMRVGEGGLWQLDTTPWGGSPSSPSVSVRNAADGEDVTASVMPGACNVFNDLIYLPKFLSASAGTFYVTVQFTNDGFNPARPMIRVDVSE